MAKGKLNIQAADGAVIGLVVPDGLTSGERQIALGANLSGVTPYHLLQGNLAVSNSTITQGFNTTLYTSGTATTNIDSDTQWGNAPEERFGVLSILKDRIEATNLFWYDTVRGATKEVNSNTTEAEATLAGGLTAFNSTGFTVGADAGHNSTANNMVSWNFQTTHRVSGTTNHGKAYTCHYNPFTGFTIVKYEGSGIAGHEIPHHLGRKLGFATVKLLAGVNDWVAQYRDNNYLYLNTAAAEVSNSTVMSFNADSTVLNGATGNGTGSWIMYGWANSYIDESNKLIGNYELVNYQGTGVAGNKVKTKGKPAWVMIKRTDATGYWTLLDNQRGNGSLSLYANLSNAEANDTSDCTFESNSFTLTNVGNDINASGGQYIALVAYDTNANGGGSYYPLASDTANVQINNALIPLAQGIDGNGAKNTILSKNETIAGLTYTQGKNYVYCDKNGSYGVTPYKPRYLESELVRTFAGESPDYYDVSKNKWFSTDNGETITNGNFNINTNGWSTDAGMTLSVSNGMLVNTAAISSSGYTYQSISTVVGKTYRLKAFINNVNMYQYGLLINDSSNTLFTETITATGAKTYDVTFVAQSTTTNIKFFRNSTAANQTLTIDNVTCFATDIIPTTEITNSRNYLNHIVHADQNGQVTYVEELPKIEYKDIIKANEYQGKNACTAWVNFDGATTPPIIRDSYNVSAVIRNGTGDYDVYFSTPMDNTQYSVNITSWRVVSYNDTGDQIYSYLLNKCKIMHFEGSTSANSPLINVQIFGGRN